MNSRKVLFSGVVYTVLIACIFILIGYAVFILTDPYPLTTREGAALAPLYLMQDGKNPFSLAYSPEYTNSYVFLQQYLSLPAIRLGGLNLQSLRLEGHIFILASVFLLYLVIRRLGEGRRVAAVLSFVFYAASLYLNTPEARADAFGLFFYICGIASVILPKKKILTWILVPFFALLGLFTKVYFFAIFPIWISYEILYGGVLKSLWKILIALATGFVMFWIVEKWVYPGYFHDNLKPFFVFSKVNIKSYSYSATQFAVMLLLLLPVLLWMFFITVKHEKRLFVWKVWRPVWTASNHDDKHEPKPLLIWGMLLSTAGTLLFLATHMGNQMTYLFHLMLPWYLLTFAAIGQRTETSINWKQVSAITALLLFTAFLRPWNYLLKDKGDWEKLYRYVDAHQQIFAPPVMSDYIIRHNKPLYNSGHTEFVQATSDCFPNYKKLTDRDRILKAGLSQESLDDVRAYYMMVWKKLEERKFDMVMLDNTESVGNYYTAQIKKYYRLTETVQVYLPHSRHLVKVGIWLPDQH